MSEAISGIGASAVAGGAQSEIDRQKLADDLDDFMTLLTTQLQHQDPLDPMDANEFTSQLVEFASVEQQIQQNANLESLISAQETSQIASVASYVGRMAEVETNQVQVYNGEAEFNYVLLDDAASSLITITDDSGRTVFSSAGNTYAGKHGVVWDGTDLSGQQLPDGLYRLSVNALDADGVPVDVTTTAIGKITGVSYAGTEPELIMTNQSLSLDKVISLQETAVELSEVDSIAAAQLAAKSSSNDAQSSATASADYLQALQTLADENPDNDTIAEQLAYAQGFNSQAYDSYVAAQEAYDTANNATSSALAAEAAQTAAAQASQAYVAAANGDQALATARAAIEAVTS